MLNNILSLLIVLLVIVSAISLFYWKVAQPVLLRRHVSKLFALRDQLRWALIEEELDANDSYVETLESIIGAIIANASRTSLWHFFWFCFRNRDRKMPEKFEDYHNNAPDLIKKLNRSAISTSFTIMLINTPIFVLLAIIVAVFVKAIKISVSGPKQIAREFVAEASEWDAANTFVICMSTSPVSVVA
ncbi:MAG: hypothetical protein LBB40_05885 [Holophagales bacterium]|jgi:hypothetical protein|nr:hypothetical protein [Holophagales bacterium]